MIKHNAHRILVTDQGYKAVNLFTQSKVIVMLRTVAASIPLISKTTELQLGMNREPIFVTEDQKALATAVKLISFYGVHRIFLVDRQEELKGVITRHS
jgi:predicted transcriptional regulator